MGSTSLIRSLARLGFDVEVSEAGPIGSRDRRLSAARVAHEMNPTRARRGFVLLVDRVADGARFRSARRRALRFILRMASLSVDRPRKAPPRAAYGGTNFRAAHGRQRHWRPIGAGRV
jgi:hypothetical protein